MSLSRKPESPVDSPGDSDFGGGRRELEEE